MSDGAVTAADYQIAARIERLPLSSWHLRVGIIIGSAWFFDGFDALAIAYVLPSLIAEWHLQSSQIGLLISMGYAGQAIGSVALGWLAERIGRVPCAFYGLLIFSVMSLVCAFAWDYQSLLWFRFVQGIGLGGEVPIMAAYINELARAERRGRFSLSYQVLFSGGLFCVAFVGSWVVPAFGWRWMFVIGGVPAVLLVPLRALLPESPRWLASRGRLADADRVMTEIERQISANGSRPLPPIPAGVPPVKQATTRIGDLFKGIYRRRTLSIWVVWAATYLIVYGLTTWMPTVWRTVYHLPLQTALNYGFYTSAAGFACALVTVVVIDFTGRKRLFAGAQLLSVIPLLYLATQSGLAPAAMMLLVIAGYAGNSIIALALSTFTAESYPTELRALGCGIGNAWLRLASVAGPIFIGWVIPIAGIDAVFLVFGIVALIGGLTTAFFATETSGRVLEQLSPSL